MAAMKAKEASHAFIMLQLRLVHVEVHAIETFDFQSDMLLDDIGDTSCYAHRWLRSTTVTDHQPPCGYTGNA